MNKSNRPGTYDEGQEVRKVIESMPIPLLLTFLRVERETDTHKTVVLSLSCIMSKQNQGDTK